jgi:hypothetical protein
MRRNINVAIFLAVLVAAGARADIRDQLDVKTGKAELVFPGISAQDATTRIKDAITQFAIPTSANLRTTPAILPARPGEPSSMQRFIRGTPVVEYKCATAYAEIVKTPPPINNPFMFAIEISQICVYPFEKGAKAYLLYTSAKSTESLTSGLFNGITKAVRGEDGDFMTKQMNEAVESIRKNLPNMLVERFEVPGKQIQEPDKNAVAALIPPPAAAVPAVAQASVSAAPVALGSNKKIEARKNLNGMGLTYHSHEQFIASIRRKDDVAVQLFLDAGGIDMTAKDTRGKTAAEIAHEVGATDIARMIAAHQNGAAPAASAQTSPQATAIAAPSAVAVRPGERRMLALNDPAVRSVAYEVAKTILSQDDLMDLNDQLEKAPLSSAQKEEVRINMTITLAELRPRFKEALVQALDARK